MVSVKKTDTSAFKLALAKFPRKEYRTDIFPEGDFLVIRAVPIKDLDAFDISRYLYDLPDHYVEHVHRLTEWWGRALGLGVTTDDPAELLEEAMDMLEQFQYDQMLTLEEALAFQDRITQFDQTVNYREEKERTEITEGTPILSYMRALTGKTLFKQTGGIGM
jgi:hypothetical protein